MLRVSECEICEAVGRIGGFDGVHDADSYDVRRGAGIERRGIGVEAIADGGDDDETVMLGECFNSSCPPALELLAEAGGDDAGFGGRLGQDVVYQEVPELIDFRAGLWRHALVVELSEIEVGRAAEGRGILAEQERADSRGVWRDAGGGGVLVVECEAGGFEAVVRYVGAVVVAWESVVNVCEAATDDGEVEAGPGEIRVDLPEAVDAAEIERLGVKGAVGVQRLSRRSGSRGRQKCRRTGCQGQYNRLLNLSCHRVVPEAARAHKATVLPPGWPTSLILVTCAQVHNTMIA